MILYRSFTIWATKRLPGNSDDNFFKFLYCLYFYSTVTLFSHFLQNLLDIYESHWSLVLYIKATTLLFWYKPLSTWGILWNWCRSWPSHLWSPIWDAYLWDSKKKNKTKKNCLLERVLCLIAFWGLNDIFCSLTLTSFLNEFFFFPESILDLISPQKFIY